MKLAYFLLALLYLIPLKSFTQIGTYRCHAVFEDQSTFIPPPPQFDAGIRTATFDINYVTFTSEAQDAFQFAADIWASILNSNVPIKVNAYYTALVQGLLGITLPNGRKNFPDAPVADVWYPSCLANAIANSELNPGETDIDLFLNSNINWYFGTDGNCPSGEFDFVSIVLHELCHGLGFVGLAKSENNLGSFGMVDAQDFSPIITSFPFPDLEGKPGVFDRFLVNEEEQPLTDTLLFSNNSSALDSEFKSNSIYFDGPTSIFVNYGNQPRMYAPAAFALGSSLVHFNESTYPAGTPNDLMTPFAGTAQVTHDPGQLAVAALIDIGWSVNYNVGLEEFLPVEEIKVFPNPANEWLQVTCNVSGIDQIEILDLAGRKMIMISQPNFPIDIATLPRGVFFCNITSGNKVFHSRFVRK